MEYRMSMETSRCVMGGRSFGVTKDVAVRRFIDLKRRRYGAFRIKAVYVDGVRYEQ